MERINLSGCAIIEKETLFLLWRIQHNHYEFPGGKVHKSEAYESAARREVREEIGCEVDIIKYIGYEDFEIEDMYFRSHKFMAKVKSCTPAIKEPDKFSKVIWMPIKDYKQYNLAPNVKKFCEKYLAGKYSLV